MTHSFKLLTRARAPLTSSRHCSQPLSTVPQVSNKCSSILRYSSNSLSKIPWQRPNSNTITSRWVSKPIWCSCSASCPNPYSTGATVSPRPHKRSATRSSARLPITPRASKTCPSTLPWVSRKATLFRDQALLWPDKNIIISSTTIKTRAQSPLASK